MKVPVSWLREYVPFDLPLRELAARLAIASCEVDRILRRGVPDENGNLGLFRVGLVLEAGKHPNADRLQLCRVDVGEGEPRQIVCGAWNFGAGDNVAVALPGAVLPGGTRLDRALLRGEFSDGMILSERELELGTDHTGILVLPAEWPPGALLDDLLPLGEDVLEIETGFNRPDLQSIYGIAREVAALTDAELAPPPGTDPLPDADEPVDVRVEDHEGCPRYVGRTFRGVEVEHAPAWMKARLAAAGVRSISNVVDATNYVMVALGNPLHAFDQHKLDEGRIVVRRAAGGETITTLDGTVRRLEPSDLVIADATTPVAIAGIMGSLQSEVDESTTDVLLESANFEPVGIQRTSERLALRTESSTRWEKGVDPYLADQAARFATQLLVELTGAAWTGRIDAHDRLPGRPVVHLRPERADELLGYEVAPEEQRPILDRLGFEVGDDDWTVVPTWRARDVTREADLVEEVGRFVLGEVPFTLPLRREMFGRLTREQRLQRTIEDVLAGLGFCEAYTSSLVGSDPDERALRLPEPLSAEHALLRTTLFPGLLDSARRNLDAANEEIALYEIARVYLPSGETLPEERRRVAGILEGDFFRVKGAVEALYEALRIEPRFERGQNAFLHPGKAAALAAGWAGELRPDLLEGAWGGFELDLEVLFPAAPEQVLYEDVLTYPGVRQDLAFVVAEGVSAGDLAAAAREAAGAELREMRVFDVYRGEQTGEGRKSIAFRVLFQSAERTLSDEDAARLRVRITAALAERFGATLRE